MQWTIKSKLCEHLGKIRYPKFIQFIQIFPWKWNFKSKRGFEGKGSLKDRPLPHKPSLDPLLLQSVWSTLAAILHFAVIQSQAKAVSGFSWQCSSGFHFQILFYTHALANVTKVRGLLYSWCGLTYLLFIYDCSWSLYDNNYFFYIWCDLKYVIVYGVDGVCIYWSNLHIW